MSSSPLSIRGLTKGFEVGTVNEKIALDHLDLEVPAGQFVTVLGSNGSGKSTLFNLILGKIFPDAGTILLNGEDITRQKDYRRALNMSCLYQNPLRGTAPNMTLEENLALAYTRKAKKSLFAVSRRDRDFFRDLLLLDEHTAALDPKTADKVLQLTEELVARDHLTTLMVTHNMKNAIQYGNRLIMMDSGRIVVDIRGEEKKHLSVRDLLEKFHIENDRMLLSE